MFSCAGRTSGRGCATQRGGENLRDPKAASRALPESRVRRVVSESGSYPNRLTDGSQVTSWNTGKDNNAKVDGNGKSCCYEGGTISRDEYKRGRRRPENGGREAMTKLGRLCAYVIVTCNLGIKQHRRVWRSRSSLREMLIWPLFLPPYLLGSVLSHPLPHPLPPCGRALRLSISFLFILCIPFHSYRTSNLSPHSTSTLQPC
jgi:hypothetical protein